jgi:hypothetical protein
LFLFGLLGAGALRCPPPLVGADTQAPRLYYLFLDKHKAK